jgi:PAS domain S-box-containing protein
MLEAELFSFLERTSDAAFAVTDTGEICFWNKSAERLFGYPAAEALDRTCSELLDGLGVLGTKVCNGSVHLCDTEHLEIPDFDLRVRTKPGGRLWVNVSTIIFDEPHHERRLIVHLARDISHRKRNEELLAKMLEISEELKAASEDMDGKAPVSPLSEQERRILRLFAQAKNSNEIARELGITLPTLRNHLHSINEKLRTHNRLEAVMNAMHRGLI